MFYDPLLWYIEHPRRRCSLCIRISNFWPRLSNGWIPWDELCASASPSLWWFRRAWLRVCWLPTTYMARKHLRCPWMPTTVGGRKLPRVYTEIINDRNISRKPTTSK
ncbi:hypothetical protein JG687_00019563, partial [Phytophthora cactorum]